jgi:hypothetical protein
MSEIGIAAGWVPARAGTMSAKASAASSQLKLSHELLVKLRFEFIMESSLFAVTVFGERSGARGVLDGSWSIQNSFGRFGTPSTSVREPAIQATVGPDAFIK